jgi:PPK2 family polyphosphate:nucleotide phosphotransferase
VKAIDRADLLVKPGHKVHLKDFDAASTGEFKHKADAHAKLAADIERLGGLQDIFFAQQQYALLVIFQGMDAAGKDGAIKHVMSGVNPQGVTVNSFKQPSTRELAHDYLWRASSVLPERGRISIFNRSYYEELTVVRVHESLLAGENLPPEPGPPRLWKDRFDDINAFERHLMRNGTIVLKFFLHLSQDEQRKRLLKRIDTPEKNWKLAPSDVHERAFWDEYQHAYEELLAKTSTEDAPWYVIPADHKWFSRAAIAQVIVAQLDALGLTYPRVTDDQRAQLAVAREELTAKKP